MNESVFRKLNEQLKQLADEFDFRDETLLLVCECGHAECQKRLHVSASTYERVRADPALFIIALGHEFETVEQVVESGPEFNIVAKQGATPNQVAAETDPRSG